MIKLASVSLKGKKNEIDSTAFNVEVTSSQDLSFDTMFNVDGVSGVVQDAGFVAGQKK